MQIAILSDMHGNCIALDAARADLQRHPVDQIVCLGDAVQGGPQPAQVVARLREIACPVVTPAPPPGAGGQCRRLAAHRPRADLG